MSKDNGLYSEDQSWPRILVSNGLDIEMPLILRQKTQKTQTNLFWKDFRGACILGSYGHHAIQRGLQGGSQGRAQWKRRKNKSGLGCLAGFLFPLAKDLQAKYFCHNSSNHS